MNDLDDLLGELGGPPADEFWNNLESEIAPEPNFTPEAKANIDTNISKRYTIMPSRAQMKQVLATPKTEDYNIAVADTDINFLTQQDPLERLFEECSTRINRFFDGHYQATNFAVKHELEMKKRNADYMKKPTAELIDSLKDKDLVVVERAAEALAEKVDDAADPRERELASSELRKEKGIRIVIDRLQHVGPGAVQTSCVRILCAISKDEANRDALRQMGGIKPVVKLIKASGADINVLLRIMTFVFNMSSGNDGWKGADAIARIGGIPYIVPFMSAQHPILQMLGMKSLLNLSGLSRNQEILSKNGIMAFMLKNLQVQAVNNRVQAAKIFENVAKSDHCQENTPTQAIEILLGLASRPHLCYNNAEAQHKNFPDNNGPKHGPEEDLILACLNTLASLAKNSINKKVMFEKQAVRILVAYPKINAKIPFDVFKWNIDVTHAALRALNNLVFESRETLKQFFEQDGMNLCLQMLTVEGFPKEFVLTVASLLSHLSSDEAFQREIGGNAILNLIRILQNFSDNEVLQFIVIRTFRALASDDNNRQKIFEEGGIQILYNLLKSDNEEIIGEVCQAFVALAPNKFIRKVIRVLGVEKLVQLLYSTNTAVIVPLLKVLTLLATDAEGVKPMMDANIMQGLVTLLYIKNAGIQENSSHVLIKLLTSDKERITFVENGGIQAIFESAKSDEPRVQFLAITILTKLCQNPNTKAALQAEGMVDVLKDLAQHKNLTGKESKLLAEFKTLVITFKRTQTGANTIKIAQGLGGESASPSSKPGITEKGYEEDSSVEVMLSKLSKPRLCSIINAMAKETNTNIREFLTVYLSERNKGDTTSAATARMFAKAPGKATGPAPPPPPGASGANRLLKPAAKTGGSMGGLLAELQRGTDLKKVEHGDRPAGPAPTKDDLGRAIIRSGDLLNIKSKLKITRKVLDQGLIEPSRTWESNLKKWNKDFQTACYYDLNLIKLIWELSESEEGVIPFKHAMSLVTGFKTEEHLANTLLKLGFAAKRTRVLLETGETIEWEALVRPGDFPQRILLKELLLCTDPSGLHIMRFEELYGK